MILDFERNSYRQMILQDRWEELAQAMDGRLRRCVLAMNAQILDYPSLHDEAMRSCQEVLTEVLDPEGGGIGFTYDYTPEAWDELFREWKMRKQAEHGENASPATIPAEHERFLHAMEVCHIPMHMLAVIPDSIPQPISLTNALAWVDMQDNLKELLAQGSYSGILSGENGVEAHVEITGEGKEGSHSAAGRYIAYTGTGYVTGYNQPIPRPITLELYEAYPEDVMIRFTLMPADEYAYQQHWQAYFSWKNHSEEMLRMELDDELGRISSAMKAEDARLQMDRYGYGNRRYGRDERSYDYGDDDQDSYYRRRKPGSFNYGEDW